MINQAQNNQIKKIGFIFGSGGEVGLGLPDGGKFALHLFKYDYDKIKEEFKDAIDAIVKNQKDDSYIQWLSYKGAQKNKIHCFNNKDFKVVLDSSVEYKNQIIRNFLSSIDELSAKAYQEYFLNQNNKLSSGEAISNNNDHNNDQYSDLKALFKDNKIDLSKLSINESIKLDDNINKFMASNTLTMVTAALRYCQSLYPEYSDQNKTNTHEDKDTQASSNNDINNRYQSIYKSLKASVKVILFMVKAVCGYDLAKELNSSFFTSNNEKDLIFNEIIGFISMDNSIAADQIFDFIKQANFDAKDSKAISDPIEKLNFVINLLALDLCAKAMDYRKLIDMNFSYIFSPSTDWAKFSKIMLFLRAAYDVITQKEVSDEDLLKDSYYNDIIDSINKEPSNFQIAALGTSNYINFYDRLLNLKIKNKNIKENCKDKFGSMMFLNGSVDEYFNPYKNALVRKHKGKDNNEDRSNNFLDNNMLVTPFLFTQTATKPITAIDISCRYTDLYRSYLDAQAILVIGFNFNYDDCHINTIFRELVENHNKHIIRLSIDEESEQEQVKELAKKLRINQEAIDRLHVIKVDRNSRKVINQSANNKLWIDEVVELLNKL